MYSEGQSQKQVIRSNDKHAITGSKVLQTEVLQYAKWKVLNVIWRLTGRQMLVV
jgi:hypothetical protein